MSVLVLFLLNLWTIEVVCNEGNYLILNSIAIDSSGNPYILVFAHRDYVPRAVYYMFLYSKVGGNWIADTFELSAGEPIMRSRGDLAIDKYNRVWCTYSAYNEVDSVECLIVARKDSSSWEKDTVSSEGAFWYQSIATDTIANPTSLLMDF